MPTFKEVADNGSDPSFPSVKEMRKSQQAGATGIGTSTHDFAQKNAIRNHGTGEGDGTTPSFAEAVPGENDAWKK